MLMWLAYFSILSAQRTKLSKWSRTRCWSSLAWEHNKVRPTRGGVSPVGRDNVANSFHLNAITFNEKNKSTLDIGLESPLQTRTASPNLVCFSTVEALDAVANVVERCGRVENGHKQGRVEVFHCRHDGAAAK